MKNFSNDYLKKVVYFLLLFPQGTQRNEFQLRLNEVGALEAEFFMGHEDELSNKHVVIGNQWNDMEWHHVRVARNFREVTVQIDDSEGMMVSFGEKDQLHLTSNVRIGGFETSSGYDNPSYIDKFLENP